MKNNKPIILISNDDGYQAKGINALVDMLSDMADLFVCAPDGPRSGYACAFTAERHLRLHPIRQEEHLQVWSCTGTPVDSVKLALNQFFTDHLPNMVIGGINHGDNASVNTHYSGTMGVTMEGCMKYIPSVLFLFVTIAIHPILSHLDPIYDTLWRKYWPRDYHGGCV